MEVCQTHITETTVPDKSLILSYLVIDKADITGFKLWISGHFVTDSSGTQLLKWNPLTWKQLNDENKMICCSNLLFLMGQDFC